MKKYKSGEFLLGLGCNITLVIWINRGNTFALQYGINPRIYRRGCS
jgi:hypothetical protein